MSNGFSRLGVMGVIIAGIIMVTAGVASAKALPGMIKALPNPPGAPQEDTFLITMPHPRLVPARAVIHFRTPSGREVTTIESLTSLHNKYQYEASWKATEEGHVSVQVYSSRDQLLAQASYPVGKSKDKVDGRVIVGALFIGASLWFWWRQRRLYQDRR